MTETDRAVGEAERLHPLFLLTGLGGSLRGLAGGYAAVGYLAVSGQLSTALLAAGALIAFVAISLALYWARFEFRVGEREIRIDSGVFSRIHRSIPFDRIQDVDISQGPVARLAGIARVKFETGATAGAGGDDGVLHAIPLRRAEELRTLIRTRRSPVESRPDAGDLEPSEAAPVYTMGLGRLALAGIFNFSLALFAGLFGVTQTMGDVVGFDPLSRTFWLRLLSASDPIADFILEHRIAAAAAGAAVLVLIGLGTGIARTILRDYGFRLHRTESGLRRRRGLVTRTDVTLRVKRAQAAIIGSGPLRSAFGWSELKVQSLAQDEGGKGDHVLAPLARPVEITGIIEALGWRPLPDEPSWQRVSRAYVWTLAIGLSPFILLCLVQLAVVNWGLSLVDPAARETILSEFAPALVAIAVVLALLLLAIGARWMAWRRTAYAIEGDRLLVRGGWWKRRLIVLPVERIQSIEIYESFVTRWFGTAWLIFGVAGGSGFANHKIPSLPRETARELRARLLD